MDILHENITALRGIGQKRADLFRTLGLYQVNDLLTYYPRAYEDRTIFKKIIEVKDGESKTGEDTKGFAIHHTAEPLPHG